MDALLSWGKQVSKQAQQQLRQTVQNIAGPELPPDRPYEEHRRAVTFLNGKLSDINTHLAAFGRHTRDSARTFQALSRDLAEVLQFIHRDRAAGPGTPSAGSPSKS
eukprot:RCo038732